MRLGAVEPRFGDGVVPYEQRRQHHEPSRAARSAGWWWRPR